MKHVTFSKKWLVLSACLLLSICGGFLLPELALNYHARRQIHQIETVQQSDNQTNPTIMKNASSQLSDYERIQLISGSWESKITAANEEEATLNKADALKLVKSSVYELYSSGHYPTNLNSGFGNWYTWDAEFLKATDKHFHTYTAYFWKFHFTHYDGEEEHTIYIMENGTLLQAVTNKTMEQDKEFTKEETKRASFVPVTKDALRTLPAYEGKQWQATDFISGYVSVKENVTLTALEEINELISQKQDYSYLLVYTAQGSAGFIYCEIPYQLARQGGKK